MKRTAMLAILFVVSGSQALVAASRLEMEHRNLLGTRPIVEHSTMIIEGDSLRIDRSSRSGAEPVSTLIFDGETQTLFVVDHAEREFVRIDRQAMQELARQMDDLERQLEEQLRQMPPEQRAMVEKMMRERGIGPNAQHPQPEPELLETSETETIAGYPCRRYTTQEGDVVSSLCVASWEDLGLGEGVPDVFSQLGEFAQTLMDSMGDSFPLAGALEQHQQPAGGEPGGFPIATREFKAGKKINEVILVNVTQVATESTAFQPPAGYRATEVTPPE